MTEEQIERELMSTKVLLSNWWKSRVKEGSYPSKLWNKIRFLNSYLKAIKLLKDEQEVNRVKQRIQGEYWKNGGFVSKL